MSCEGNTGFLVNDSEFSKTSDYYIYITFFGIFFGNGSNLLNFGDTTLTCNKPRFSSNI